MVLRLGKLYARRIVNVNVNIVAAGLLALAPTVGLVHLSDIVGFTEWLAKVFRVNPEFVVNGITFVCDVVCDVAIYYCLHWLANHWPRRAAQKLHLPQPHPIHPTFLKDATMVQVERMTLSPLLYALWLGTQHMLLVRGVGLTYATVAGGVLGIGTTRVLHTLWMLRQQRRWAKRAEQTAKAAGRHCPKCNAGVSDSASACPGCGSPLEAPGATIGAPTASEPAVASTTERTP